MNGLLDIIKTAHKKSYTDDTIDGITLDRVWAESELDYRTDVLRVTHEHLYNIVKTTLKCPL